jgi:hypothetical protein
MFEFRLRILDVRERDTDPPSFLGIVEGFPEVLVHATSFGQTEVVLTNAIIEHLKRLQDREATRIDPDDFPTVRIHRLCLSPLRARRATRHRGRRGLGRSATYKD